MTSSKRNGSTPAEKSALTRHRLWDAFKAALPANPLWQNRNRGPEPRWLAAEKPADHGVPVVRLKGISKSFGPVRANDDISLDIRAGRVLALLGENGAGKSTLMSILAGRYLPDAGEIVLDGRRVAFESPREAIEAGIGMVYQHFMLVDSMSVAENVLLGQESGFLLNPREMRREVGELAAAYGLEVDPAAKVGSLSMGERQRVEILRLLYRRSRVLIFDEPTAVLTPPEIEQFSAALKSMAAQGKAIVFISHKLEEVLELADDIAVLRRGRLSDAIPASAVTSKGELAERMVGREVMLAVDKPSATLGETVLEIEDLAGEGLNGLSLRLRQGEIVAVVGVAGNGQKELVEVLAGLSAPGAGSVRVLGRPWREFWAAPPWKGAVAYVPEDRLGLATCRELDLVDNLLLTTRRGFARGPLLDFAAALDETERLVREADVQPPLPRAQARQLSGGNLQKLVLAREFSREPRIIIAEQPTQGLDVSATEEVWRRLVQARRRAGVLLVTGDLTEALSLADRVAVMFRGRFMDVFPLSDSERLARIGLLMAGVSDAPGAPGAQS